MSISFTAQDSPAGEPQVFECQCVDYATKVTNPTCPECKGTGKIRFNCLAYDVNFSNSNALPFTELFTPDGMAEYCGCIKAEDMAKAIEKVHCSFRTSEWHKTLLLPVLEWARDNGKDVTWG